MTASDEFKAQLKSENLNSEGLQQAFMNALSEALELEITTWVSTINTDNSASDQPKPGMRMRTRINILDGDIENEVGSQFLSNQSYAELRNFHIEQVEDSRKIIQENLGNLQELFSILSRSVQHLPAQNQPRLGASPNSGLPQ